MAALFINPDDFLVRPYRIPNLQEAKDFQDYLESKEAEILKSLLGPVMYDDFIVQPIVEQRWVDLRDGAEYSLYSEDYIYPGIKQFLIPAVYADWLADSYDKHTDTGIVVHTKENTELISPSLRISRAWNHFVSLVGDSVNYENTLWGFLKANEEDYPEWKFKKPETINIFNL